LGYKILNVVTWVKTNPPPNISCRYFTYSTEFVIWARKHKHKPHFFNYDLMKKLNGGHQMTDVWRMPAIAPWEKTFGKHPTQKPLALLCRILLASTPENGWVLDPFAGSSTTGIAANLAYRRYLGIEQDAGYAQIGANRRQAMDQDLVRGKWTAKLKDLGTAFTTTPADFCSEPSPPTYGLPF
jgi:site-specific DNA-methyltransferase (adenine-specific)